MGPPASGAGEGVCASPLGGRGGSGGLFELESPDC